MCITRCPKAFISGVGLKPYLSAGMASAAAVMFFEKRGRMSLSAPLTGLLTVPSLAISCAPAGFDCAAVPAAGAACCACALVAANDRARAIQPNLFCVISFLLAAHPSARPESILPALVANNLVRKNESGSRHAPRAAAARIQDTKRAQLAGLLLFLFRFVLLFLLLLFILLLVLRRIVRLCRFRLCRVLLRCVRLRCVLRVSGAGNTQERCERQGPKQLFHTSSSAMIVQDVRRNLCWKETAPPRNQRFPVSGARRYPPLQRQDCR